MSADERGWSMDELTERVIGCAFRVSNELGVGFLEKVYENALAYEIRKQGIRCEQQVGLPVYYDGVVVGDYAMDLLVEGRLVVELKHCKTLDDVHLAQTLNYLKATGHALALLINFGQSKVEIRRVVLSHR